MTCNPALRLGGMLGDPEGASGYTSRPLRGDGSVFTYILYAYIVLYCFIVPCCVFISFYFHFGLFGAHVGRPWSTLGRLGLPGGNALVCLVTWGRLSAAL